MAISNHERVGKALDLLKDGLRPFIERAGYKQIPGDEAWLEKMIATLRERAKTLVELVDFAKFFTMLKAARFSGPFQLHYELPELGGANEGKTSMSISRETFISILRRDLTYMRNLLKEAQMV